VKPVTSKIKLRITQSTRLVKGQNKMYVHTHIQSKHANNVTKKQYNHVCSAWGTTPNWRSYTQHQEMLPSLYWCSVYLLQKDTCTFCYLPFWKESALLRLKKVILHAAKNCRRMLYHTCSIEWLQTYQGHAKFGPQAKFNNKEAMRTVYSNPSHTVPYNNKIISQVFISFLLSVSVWQVGGWGSNSKC